MMTTKLDSEQLLLRNLKDAGCNQDLIERFLELEEAV